MLTEADILDALRVCFDPELPVNIVDLGLVHGVSVAVDTTAPGVDPRYAVVVTMTMRAPNEEREPMLAAQVENRLMGIEAIRRATVQMVWHPSWSPDRMNAAARQQLGLDRSPKSDLIQIQL